MSLLDLIRHDVTIRVEGCPNFGVSHHLLLDSHRSAHGIQP